MKNLGLFCLLLFFGHLSAQSDGLLEQSRYEHILSFDSYITIDTEGAVSITEKIKVYAAGSEIKRGIFRTLPLWRNLNNKKNRVQYDIVSLTKNGEPEKYHTEKKNADLVIYFGKKDKILSPGVYEYVFQYKTADQIGFFPKYDEFYWNVNGNLWNFKVDSISAKVTLPKGAKILQQACYTGAYGETGMRCASSEINAHTLLFTAKDLGQNEGLTVAVGIEKGLMAPPPPPGFFEKYGILLLSLVAGCILLYYCYYAWQKYGVDPEKPVVYPQFSSPGAISPASAGYLREEYFKNELITASVISLAVKGYLRIVEKDNRILGLFGSKTYTLEKLRDSDETLPAEEETLMTKLFGSGDAAITLDGKYNSKIENAVTSYKASLAYQHDKFLNEGNNSSLLLFPALLILGVYAFIVYLAYRQTYSEAMVVATAMFGVLAMVITIFFIAFSKRSKAVPWFFGILMVGFGAVFLGLILSDPEGENVKFYSAFLFLIFGLASFYVFQHLIKKPSREKLEVQSLIEGFKMYLGTAEEKTLQFHNPPKMTPEIFETFLPFAMVFGVEKIWGDKFNTILKNSGMAADQYQSHWYAGSAVTHMNFAGALNSSLSHSIASSATQPSSSGSGSGGGGFSGGGGGGGGGGGW